MLSDAEFLQNFEDTSLTYKEWTHRAHIKVAYLYLKGHPFPEACERIRKGIQTFNRSKCVPEGPTMGYSETTTMAFVHLVASVLAAYESVMPSTSADQFCDLHPQLMTTSVLRLFYSPNRE